MRDLASTTIGAIATYLNRNPRASAIAQHSVDRYNVASQLHQALINHSSDIPNLDRNFPEELGKNTRWGGFREALIYAHMCKQPVSMSFQATNGHWIEQIVTGQMDNDGNPLSHEAYRQQCSIDGLSPKAPLKLQLQGNHWQPIHQDNVLAVPGDGLCFYHSLIKAQDLANSQQPSPSLVNTQNHSLTVAVDNRKAPQETIAVKQPCAPACAPEITYTTAPEITYNKIPTPVFKPAPTETQAILEATFKSLMDNETACFDSDVTLQMETLLQQYTQVEREAYLDAKLQEASSNHPLDKQQPAKQVTLDSVFDLLCDAVNGENDSDTIKPGREVTGSLGRHGLFSNPAITYEQPHSKNFKTPQTR